MSLSTNKRQVLFDEHLRRILVSGRIPSTAELVSYLQTIIATDRDDVTGLPPSYQQDDVLQTTTFNAFSDSISDDIASMRETIDAAWATLENAIQRSAQFQTLATRGDVLARTARGVLSRLGEADAFYLGAAIPLDSDAALDATLSDDYAVNELAGTLSIAKSGETPISPSAISVESTELRTETGQVDATYVGSPEMVLMDSVVQRYIVEAYSTDDDIHHELEFVFRIAEDAKSARMLSDVVIDTSSIGVQTATVETTYDGKNWERLGETTGNHHLTVSGERRYATLVRLVLHKDQADGRRLVSENTWRCVYAFDVEGVAICEAGYAPVADVVTLPIPLKSDGVAKVIVDADETIPAGASIEYFVADDVADPDTIGDFNWKRADRGAPVEVGNTLSSVDSFTCRTAAKLVAGTGTRADVWDAGTVAGDIVDVYCGINQALVRSALAATPAAVVLEASGPVTGAVTYRDVGGAMTLAGGYYYGITLGVYADFPDPASLELTMPTDAEAGIDYLISLNGRDITTSYDGRRVPLGLSSGYNKIVIAIKRDDLNAFQVSVGKLPTHRLALMHPMLVAESRLDTADAAVACADAHLRCNFDPRNLNFEVRCRTLVPGMPSGSMRVRARLTAGPNGGTPSLANWHVISGG